MLWGSGGWTYWPFNGGTEKHFNTPRECNCLFTLLKVGRGLTKLKIPISLASLYPGCHNKAHIIRTAAGPPSRGAFQASPPLSLKLIALTGASTSETSNFLSGSYSARQHQLLKQLCWRFWVSPVFLSLTLPLSWRQYNQQVLIKK